MGKTVIWVRYNLLPCGEEESKSVGRTCDKIEYHEPRGDGDRHYCDITIGVETTRVFNLSEVCFKEQSHE